jgi:hypothetical protein
MTVISVDLAYKHYNDIGIVVLKCAEDHIAVNPIRLVSDPGLTGCPNAGVLADFLVDRAMEIGVTTILVDGTQAWKSQGNGIDHSRLCERRLATPGKTGLPGLTKPANYLGFTEFSIELFGHLEARGWPRLNIVQSAAPLVRVAVESFPTAAWRSLGLTPLSGKRRSSPAHVRAKLGELEQWFQLKVTSDLNHDELQALVAGLAGLALADGQQDGYELVGSAPVHEDGYWREGFIICPTHDVIAEFRRDNAG